MTPDTVGELGFALKSYGSIQQAISNAAGNVFRSHIGF
jgi:hypothetical protein